MQLDFEELDRIEGERAAADKEAPARVLAVVFDMFETLLTMADRKQPSPWQHLWRTAQKELAPGLMSKFKLGVASTYVMTHNGAAEDVVLDAITSQCKGMPRAPLEALCEKLCFVEEVHAEASSVELYSETLSTLRTLRERGYRIACCSNLSTPYGGALHEVGIQEYFDEVIYSYEVGAVKGRGDNAIYELVGERLGLPLANILFVGDSLIADYTGPLAAGMQAVHLNRDGGDSEGRATIRALDDLLVLDVLC